MPILRSGLLLDFLLHVVADVPLVRIAEAILVLVPKRDDVLDATMHLGDLYTESGQTLQGSFSAVSKPNFASKDSFDSSRRDLHNALLRTAL